MGTEINYLVARKGSYAIRSILDLSIFTFSWRVLKKRWRSFEEVPLIMVDFCIRIRSDFSIWSQKTGLVVINWLMMLYVL